MGRISTGIGLVSGINSKDIIDQLMSLESRSKDTLKVRIEQTNQRKLAYSDLAARLSALRISGSTLKRPTTFQQTKATTSNENVLTAQSASGAAKGTYQFQVSRLVSNQQSITSGFASADTKVGAGTITIEMGGGEIHSQTTLAQLNGGAGVRAGMFRVTDRSGRSAAIDISSALTLDDVAKRINTSLDISVRAEIRGDKLVLTDLTGQAATNLSVADMGGGHAAADLGIAGTAGGASLEGSNVNYVGRSSLLAQLNDGRGVRTTSNGTADFRITAADGTTFDIQLAGSKTVGAVLDAINSATGGKVVASAAAGEKRLRLNDTTGGAGTLTVTALNSSKAAADLGLDRPAVGTEIAGATVLASLNTVLISSLRGGTGLSLGQIDIIDRAGAAATVNLSGAETVQDLLDRINSNGSAAVQARLNSAGNGIEIVDTSGGTGNLAIADNASTTATDLGIAGTFSLATASARGKNLQRQWVNENTLLSGYNGGRGVAPGKFKITNSLGTSATIDLSQADDVTLGDVIRQINASGISVTASINTNGDGLLLTDTAGGAGQNMKVEEIAGTTAADLGIRTTAAAGVIDGSFEKTITVGANDTLTTVMGLINEKAFGLSASLINDGSGATPWRLSLTSRNSGRAGRVTFDAGTTGLAASNLVEAQDAVVFFGGGTAASSLLVTSSTNQITGLIRGVTIELNGVSSSPVTVSIADNYENVVDQLKKFVDGFNGLADRLHELTKFDTDTNARGLLLGESTVQTVEREAYAIIHSVVQGAGQFKVLADIGIKSADGAKLEFDEDKFRAAWGKDSEAVKKLFTLFVKGDTATKTPDQKGFGTIIDDRINKLIDPASGILTRQNKSLDERTDQFQNRIEQMDVMLQKKRERLERQFANLESVLAGLQSQQQAITNLSSLFQTQNNSKK